MRFILILLAVLAFTAANSASAQCVDGNCPRLQIQQANSRLVAAPLARPIVRTVTAPVRAIREVQPVRRVLRRPSASKASASKAECFEGRVLQNVRTRVQARRAARGW
jgi:hypothetical protein